MVTRRGSHSIAWVITSPGNLNEVETIQTKGAAQTRTTRVPMSQIGTSAGSIPRLPRYRRKRAPRGAEPANHARSRSTSRCAMVRTTMTAKSIIATADA